MDFVGDYLNAMELEFQEVRDFVTYLERDYNIASFPGEFNVIGAMNNLDGGASEFLSELKGPFEIFDSSGDLYLIFTQVENEPVYHYVYLDDDTPIFFTAANKTDQIPPTIWRFLQLTEGIGRLMLSKRQIDELRQRISTEHSNLLVPFFSARRTARSPIDAKRRPDTKRSIQYRADDGLQTYRELRFNYGVLPKIMVFEKPNVFKFKVKQEGIFVHQRGSLLALWKYITDEIERATEMKKYANMGGYGRAKSSFFEEDGFRVSTPWAIKVKSGIDKVHVESFESQLSEAFWEFGVSEFTAQMEAPSFQAEVIDATSHERTTMKTKGDQVRVFPREHTDIDQSLRLYNFISDHFDSECNPLKVA